MNQRITLILRLLVSITLIIAIFKFIPYQQLIKLYNSANKLYIFLAFAIFFFDLVLGAERWKFLLLSLGIKISSREVFYASFSALFFNLFFPSFVAGDVFRGISVSLRYGSKAKIASSVLMDRFSGVVGLSIVAFFSFITGGFLVGKNLIRNQVIVLSIFVLFLAIILVVLLIVYKPIFSSVTLLFKNRPNLREKIVTFHDELAFFVKNPKVFAKSLLFSIPIQIINCLSFFAVAKAFGSTVEVIYFLIIVPIICAIATIPISIAGIGTREFSSMYFFSLIGMQRSIALSISLLNLAFIALTGILGGLFYVSLYHRWLQSSAQD